MVDSTNSSDLDYQIDREKVCASVHSLISLLVQHEEAELHLVEGEESVFIEILIPDADMGKVIGRDGSIISSIRKLYGSIMAQEKLRINISVIPSDKRR